jgi:hypothetical protein
LVIERFARSISASADRWKRVFATTVPRAVNNLLDMDFAMRGNFDPVRASLRHVCIGKIYQRTGKKCRVPGNSCCGA